MLLLKILPFGNEEMKLAILCAAAKQNSANYERKIFPFGDKQKERVKSFISENIKSSKTLTNEAFYQYVVYRQMLADDNFDSYSEWYHSSFGKLFTHEEKALIRAYACLDKQLTSDEDINEEALNELTKQYASEPAPEKPRRKSLFKF